VDPGSFSAEEPLWGAEEEQYTPAAPASTQARPARVRSGRVGSERIGSEHIEPAQGESAQGESGPGGEPAGRAAAKPARNPGEQAREICLRQLAVRPRTRAELTTALRKRGISDEVAAEVLDRYDEVGLIDDAAFARAWVDSRQHGRGLSRRALADELRRKGVDAELAGAALAEIDAESEAATARALIDRKLRTMPAGPPDVVFRRLVSMLARKGYSAGLSIRVVKDALAARTDEIGAFADLVDPDALPDLVGDQDDPIR
jgi:regulatory protein